MRKADSQNGQPLPSIVTRSGEPTGVPPANGQSPRGWPVFWRVEGFDFEQTLGDIHRELVDLNREAVVLAAKIQENFEELGA